MSLTELKRALKEEKLVYGTDATIKNIKRGITKAVFIAINCSPTTQAHIKHYNTMHAFTIYKLEEPSDELALICKKKFNVSLLSY